MNCAQHPETETYVRCAKCDTPVCAECMVTGPVGIRCRTCARPAESPLFKPKPTGLLRAGVLGAATGLLLGWAMKLFLLVAPAAIGCLIGEVVLRGGGRKRGKLMEALAGGSAALAALVWMVPWIQFLTKGPLAIIPWLVNPMGLLLTLASAAIAVACAVGRVRYL